MKHRLLTLGPIGLALAVPVLAQRGTPSNSLARAQSTLATADADRDGRLTAEESKTIPLTTQEFQAQDLDKDGFWSRDEFMLYYRQRLVAGGQAVGADLESEVARIQALGRAKAVEDARKRAQTEAGEAQRPAGSEARGAAPSADEDATTTRLRNALDDIEKRAAAGQATRDDFQRLRNLLIARARAAATGGSGAGSSGDAGLQGETYRKMTQSLDRLEKRAGEGQYSREEYQELREMIVRRARAIETGAGGTPPPPASDAASVQAGLAAALDHLEKRAAAGGATREDFQRVRDLMVARARAAVGPGAGGTVDPGENGGSGTETLRKMNQSLDRLEKLAAEGRYSREEYQQLREMIIRRARVIDTSAAPGQGGPAATRQKAAEAEAKAGENAPRDPQPAPTTAPRDPVAPPTRARPTGETPKPDDNAKRPAPPPAPAPAPAPKPPAEREKEKEKPPPQRPPQVPREGERPRG